MKVYAYLRRTTSTTATLGTRSRLPGVVRSTCRVPANFLAEGRIVVTVSVATFDPLVNHAVERDAIAFQVVDRSTRGGGARDPRQRMARSRAAPSRMARRFPAVSHGGQAARASPNTVNLSLAVTTRPSRSRGSSPNRTCPICDGIAELVWEDLYDDRYGYPGNHPLFVCGRCGHRFLATAFSSADIRTLYTDYYPRGVFNTDEFRPYVEVHGFQAWLEGERASAFRWVPKGVRVLDVGCGLGETLAYHMARGCDAHGVDADENVLRVAERLGLNARAGLFHAEDYESESFDFVTLDQVIEHAVDPRSLLRDVANVLRPGGTAIVTTPNSSGYGGRLLGHRWLNWHVPYHLHQFSRRSMTIVAEQSGLRVVSVRTLTNSRWLHYRVVSPLDIPKARRSLALLGSSSFRRRPARAAATGRRSPLPVEGIPPCHPASRSVRDWRQLPVLSAETVA